MKLEVKTKEQVNSYYQEVELEMRTIYLKLKKLFSVSGDEKSLKDLEDTEIYHTFIKKIKDKGRLCPSGKTGGIMFVGTNPSVRSSLKNLWDDPFGKYFKSFLDKAELDHTKVWMTNIYKKATNLNRPLKPEEIDEGIKELLLEIAYVNPSIVILFGKQVSGAFNINGTYKIGTLTLKKAERKYPVISFPHPSYINVYASQDERSLFIKQLSELKKYE